MRELRGSVHTENGNTTVTMRIPLGAAPSEVWKTVTDRRLLARWMGSLTGGGEVGSDYRIIFDESDPTALVTGQIRHCIHGQELILTWQAPGEPVSLVTVRLAAAGVGTVLHLTHTGLSGPGSGTGHAAGWQVHLEQLAAGLADDDWADRWEDWPTLQRAYEQVVPQTPATSNPEEPT
ncbi:SRPBCC domain-containing protein [Luteococcus sp. OSA5]|uniref:SRPBCC domain-containing protein n=1 Tax=Luteococcus sp. OSA5 TaxID=3401630 RepID=UPI003B438F7D